MSRKQFITSPVAALLFLTIACGALLSEGSVHATPRRKEFNPFRYLPAGAEIRNRKSDVVFADLDGDGRKEVVIFYMLTQTGVPVGAREIEAHVLVLQRSGRTYRKLWENIDQNSHAFTKPTGVYDLTKNGRPEIVVNRVVGASCLGIFDIYTYQSVRRRIQYR